MCKNTVLGLISSLNMEKDFHVSYLYGHLARGSKSAALFVHVNVRICEGFMNGVFWYGDFVQCCPEGLNAGIFGMRLEHTQPFTPEHTLARASHPARCLCHNHELFGLNQLHQSIYTLYHHYEIIYCAFPY
jgi:hypothetical protein